MMKIGFQTQSLPKFRILQIGDVHYPEWGPRPSEIDIKKNSLSESIIGNMNSDGFSNLLRLISNADFLDDCNAVVFMGDFTSKGNRDMLSRCIRHLSSLFRIKTNSSNPKFHAVPGNHDVNKDFAKSKGMLKKFDELETLLKDHGFSGLPIIHPLSMQVGDGNRPLKLVLINTTLGSWEEVGLPSEIKEQIEALDAMDDNVCNQADVVQMGNPIPIEPSVSYYDQLDTPFVSKETLGGLKEDLQNDEMASLICVVGHHNLLPQSTPRVSPYGELLNQGEFRKAIMSIGKTVIYLHGHIHQAGVEILTNPSYPNGKIIVISAPGMEDGVNVVDIYFSKNGEPMGMSLSPIRIDDSGHPRLGDVVEISLSSDANPNIWSKYFAPILDILGDNKICWNDLVDGMKEISSCDEDELESAVMSLFWRGHIRIVYKSVPRSRWILERVRI